MGAANQNLLNLQQNCQKKKKSHHMTRCVKWINWLDFVKSERKTENVSYYSNKKTTCLSLKGETVQCFNFLFSILTSCTKIIQIEEWKFLILKVSFQQWHKILHQRGCVATQVMKWGHKLYICLMQTGCLPNAATLVCGQNSTNVLSELMALKSNYSHQQKTRECYLH